MTDTQKHIKRMVKSYAEDDVLEDAVLDVAIYVRVSTSSQTTENQLIELSEVCDRNKWHITNVYNETISGTKGVDERAELNRLMQDADGVSRENIYDTRSDAEKRLDDKLIYTDVEEPNWAYTIHELINGSSSTTGAKEILLSVCDGYFLKHPTKTYIG